MQNDSYFDHDNMPDACGARGCYPDRLCANCRLRDGDVCEECGFPGELVNDGIVTCQQCLAKYAPRLTLSPLVAEPPTETISALAACIVSTYGLVSPRLCDPDEATVVEKFFSGGLQ